LGAGGKGQGEKSLRRIAEKAKVGRMQTRGHCDVGREIYDLSRLCPGL